MEIVKMPRLGVTMEEAVLTCWLKKEGDIVQTGDELFEIETEKLTTTIEAQTSGILGKILVEEGTLVKIEEKLAVIINEGEDIDHEAIQTEQPTSKGEGFEEEKKEQKKKAVASQKSSSVRAAPKARKYAQDRGIDLAKIQGSGAGGAITLEDIQKYEEQQGLELTVKDRIPLSSMLKTMKQHINKSWQEIPQFTQIIEVQAENILHCKDRNKVSMNALMIKAISDAVKKNWMINSNLNDDEILVYNNINVGLAMATESGLVVPVIKGTENKDREVIDEEIKALVAKRNLDLNDLSGGTVTFSNLGKYGIKRGVSLINYPQCCLVFMGELYKKVDVDEECNIVVKDVFELSITFDHRYITGVMAAEFSRDLKSEIENIT